MSDTLPEEITAEWLEELAERMTPGQFRYLQNNLNGVSGLAERIEAQIPDVGEVMGSITSDGYFTQAIDIPPGHTVKFRTLASGMQDRVFKRQDPDDVQDSREKQRRRLGYGLLELDGKDFGTMAIKGSFYELVGNEETIEELDNNCESRMSRLKMTPEVFVQHLAQAYSLWERSISSLIKETIDSGESPVKKSTGTPGNSASRG